MTCEFNVLNIGTDRPRKAWCIVHNTKAIRHDTDTRWVCQSEEAARQQLADYNASGCMVFAKGPTMNPSAETPQSLTKRLHADGHRSHVVEWNDADPSRPRLVRREAEQPLTWAEVLAAGSKDMAADVMLEYSGQPERSSELEMQEQGARLELIGPISAGQVRRGVWTCDCCGAPVKKMCSLCDTCDESLFKQELLGEFIQDRSAMLDALKSGQRIHAPACRCQHCDACAHGPWLENEANRWLDRRGREHAGVAAGLWAVTSGKRTERDERGDWRRKPCPV